MPASFAYDAHPDPFFPRRPVFDTSAGVTVVLKSSWRHDKASSRDSSTYMPEDCCTSYSTASTQTNRRHEVHVQTMDTSISWTMTCEELEEHVARLAPRLPFLTAVMLDELDLDRHSTAFSVFDTQVETLRHVKDPTHQSDPPLQDNHLLLTLAFDVPASLSSVTTSSYSPPSNSVTASQSTGVSWNSTGSTVAVAYGNTTHSGWCEYRSAVCCWNVFHPNFDPHVPDVILEASSGLMCVACHPTIPSILAAGSYNGEVLVWNTSTENEDPLQCTSEIGDYFHHEPIASIVWIWCREEKAYQLLTTSGDGKVLTWSLLNNLVAPVSGYLLSGLDTRHHKTPCRGGTALAFNPSAAASGRYFLVGTEGGAVIRCTSRLSTPCPLPSSDRRYHALNWSSTAIRMMSTLSLAHQALVSQHVTTYLTSHRLNTQEEISVTTLLASKPPLEILYAPAPSFPLASHYGTIHALAWSPFHRNCVASASLDGHIHLYNILEATPVWTTAPARNCYVLALAWSTTRPMVFAAAANDGNVYVYDLLKSRMEPSVVLSPPQQESKVHRRGSSASSTRSLYSLAFNPKQRNFLAGAASDGTVLIWKLDWHLSNRVDPLEKSKLEALVSLSPS